MENNNFCIKQASKQGKYRGLKGYTSVFIGISVPLLSIMQSLPLKWRIDRWLHCSVLDYPHTAKIEVLHIPELQRSRNAGVHARIDWDGRVSATPSLLSAGANGAAPMCVFRVRENGPWLVLCWREACYSNVVLKFNSWLLSFALFKDSVMVGWIILLQSFDTLTHRNHVR